MHACQSCGDGWHCADLEDYIWQDVHMPNEFECPFHENQGTRALWTCPNCCARAWRDTIAPMIRENFLRTLGLGPGGLPEGARRCACNRCARH